MRARRAWVLLPALLALACATATTAPPSVPFAPPEAWASTAGPTVEGQEAPQAEDLAPWWQEFADPRLDQLVAEALAQSPTLDAARARWTAAVEAARTAGAGARPQANLSLDGARRQQNFIGLPIPGAEGRVLSNTSTSLGLTLGAAWEIDLWGRLAAGTLAAQVRGEAAAADLAALQLSLVGQVAKAWFGWLEAEQQMALAGESLASRRRTREQIESRYRLGLRGPLDLRLARTSEADAEAQLATRSQTADRAARRLEVLVARYPSGRSLGGDRSQPPAGQPMAREATLPTLPPALAPTLPAELVTRRPDLAAAERRLAASGLDAQGARRALYPQLRLTASAGRSSTELQDLVDQDFSVWSLAAGLLQPLFQGGRLRAAVDVAEARRQEAAANYIATALNAFAEVEGALAAERFIDQQLEALTAAAAEALAARELAERRYLSGLADYLTVLESQRQATASQSQLLAARRQSLDNRVDLHLALGGDHEPLPQPATDDAGKSP